MRILLRILVRILLRILLRILVRILLGILLRILLRILVPRSSGHGTALLQGFQSYIRCDRLILLRNDTIHTHTYPSPWARVWRQNYPPRVQEGPYSLHWDQLTQASALILQGLHLAVKDCKGPQKEKDSCKIKRLLMFTASKIEKFVSF